MIPDVRVDLCFKVMGTRIPVDHGFALYGWLGDAYGLRGEPLVARRCSGKPGFIDPSAVDWRHIQDADLKESKFNNHSCFTGLIKQHPGRRSKRIEMGYFAGI